MCFSLLGYCVNAITNYAKVRTHKKRQSTMSTEQEVVCKEPSNDVSFKIRNRIYIMQSMSMSLTDSEFPVLIALVYLKRIAETTKIHEAYLQTMLMFATTVAIKYFNEDRLNYSLHFCHFFPHDFTLTMFTDKERFILNLLKFNTHVTEKDVDMSIFDTTTHRITTSSYFMQNPHEYIKTMLNNDAIELI